MYDVPLLPDDELRDLDLLLDIADFEPEVILTLFLEAGTVTSVSVVSS